MREQPKDYDDDPWDEDEPQAGCAGMIMGMALSSLVWVLIFLGLWWTGVFK